MLQSQYLTKHQIQKTSKVSQKVELLPLKQIKSGTMKDVKCKEGYVLVIKTGNGHPVCVKPQTAEKLVKRGLVHYFK